MMRKVCFVFCFLLLNSIPGVYAQDSVSNSSRGFEFTPVIELKTTPVKDQHRSGTCWSFASISFIESELMRMGKPEMDLSEMFVVWHCYSRKAEKYVRMHGHTNFGPGGAFHDVTWVLKNFGMVPQSAYSGLTIEEDKPVHSEMDEVLKSHVEAVVKNKNKKLSPVWQNAFNELLNQYLGELPQTFEYEEKEYTPLSFANNYLDINPDDYVEIGSFTHHPFYEKFIIEIPDNWLWDEIYNVPLHEMMEIIDNALESGYTVAWGADVSDKGFVSKDVGVALVPTTDITQMDDAEIARWENMSESEREKELYKIKGPCPEKDITQVMRQIDFDNYTSTDDHGMHIVGTATDQEGNTYYTVKNSWGKYNTYDGYFYASKAYVALRTIDIMVHKDAVPQNIAKKLDIVR